MFENLINYLYIIPCACIAITLHEFAHGLISYLLGDETPKLDGRLTLNPVKHFDLVGLFALIFVGFGWAKPVRINPNYYKNKKWGITIVGLAGPLTNILIALFSFIMIAFILLLNLDNNIFIEIIINFFNYLAIINLSLGIFNLIPIPPLDGSKIIGCILPKKAYDEYMSYQKYGMFFMLGIILFFSVLEMLGFTSPLSLLIEKIYTYFINLILKIIS